MSDSDKACGSGSYLSLFVSELGAVCLQVVHDALHTAGAEQPEGEGKTNMDNMLSAGYLDSLSFKLKSDGCFKKVHFPPLSVSHCCDAFRLGSALQDEINDEIFLLSRKSMNRPKPITKYKII